MATLIAVYNSDGCIGRCDAKCTEATTPECTCICGGMNHGAGRDKAIANTREMAERWITEYAKEHGPIVKAELGQDVLQLSLW